MQIARYETLLKCKFLEGKTSLKCNITSVISHNVWYHLSINEKSGIFAV